MRVVVDEVAWSGEEVRQATVRLWERTRRMPGVELTSAGACGDLSGLVVTVSEPLDEARRGRLQERFAEIAGIPVKVVEGEAVVMLDGGDAVSD
ncbi:hypothetical protein [Nocardioides sp. zg-DK7169]|uniref:hypothetical protein n=1 Tax=Nocardioides sp. zg-DK7169 TaxID=2736600 RepID=UPI001551D1BE|nr:hypothetical protein [Nocardioides sp. zg-DK7169]NPC97069.1 hypothetical protein [Nocardioides sp. zg-DK7169]